EEVVELFEESGKYNVVTPIKVLQAAEYGTPQSRRRMILLGSRKDVNLPTYPEATHTPRTLKGTAPLVKAEDQPLGPSVLDAIGDLPDADTFDELLHDDNVSKVTFGKPSI